MSIGDGILMETPYSMEIQKNEIEPFFICCTYCTSELFFFIFFRYCRLNPLTVSRGRSLYICSKSDMVRLPLSNSCLGWRTFLSSKANKNWQKHISSYSYTYNIVITLNLFFIFFLSGAIFRDRLQILRLFITVCASDSYEICTFV